jgi:hypothetical protein
LDANGNVQQDTGEHIVGNHKGQFGGFNIVNPRPGTVHQFGTRRDILSARQRGWWVADPEADGKPAYMLAGDYASDLPTSQLTGDTPYPEYVHLVTTEENYRRLMNEQVEANEAALAPAGLDFLQGATAEEYELGRGEGGRHAPTRFATRDHGTFVMHGDRVAEQLTPRGILREENI